MGLISRVSSRTYRDTMPDTETFKKPIGFKSRKRKGQARTTVIVEKKDEDEEKEEVKFDKFGMREMSKIEHLKSLHKKRKRAVGIRAQGLTVEELKRQEAEEKYKEQAWKKQGGLMSAD